MIEIFVSFNSSGVVFSKYCYLDNEYETIKSLCHLIIVRIVFYIFNHYCYAQMLHRQHKCLKPYQSPHYLASVLLSNLCLICQRLKSSYEHVKVKSEEISL